MNGTDNNQPDPFVAAFEAEMGAESSNPVTPPTDPTPPAPAPASNGEGEGGKETPPADEGKVDQPSNPQGGEKTDEEKAQEAEAELVKNETPEETQARHDKEAAEKAAAEAPKPLTQEDIRAAIAADRSETQGRVDSVHRASEEIISNLYPEGIDRTIYDSEGRAIKTAQDIVDRGLVKENGEAYTYEEAASFILEANRKMDANIEELQNWAEGIAEKNVSLLEGNQRVMSKWGEVLDGLDKEKREQLAATYIQKQLRFDKSNSYILEMAMTPEEFYDLALAPYTQLREANSRAEALEKQQQERQQQQEQAERNGIPPQRGTSEVKSNTGDAFLDALVDELAKP